MDAEWFCIINGREFGPLSNSEIRAMAQRGDLQPEDLVRRGKNNPWVLAHKVRGLLSSTGPRPSMPPARPAGRPVREPRPVSSGAVVPLDDDEEPLPVADSAPVLPVAEPLRKKAAEQRAAEARRREAAGEEADDGPPSKREFSTRPRPVPVPAGGGKSGASDPGAVLDMIADAAYSGAPLPDERSRSGGSVRRKRRKGVPPMVFGIAGALLAAIGILIAVMVIGNQPASSRFAATPDEIAERQKAEDKGKPKSETAAKPINWEPNLTATCCGGAVEVRIAGADVKYAKFTKDAAVAPHDIGTQYLVLVLEIENKDSAKKVEYAPWNTYRSSLNGVTLIDKNNQTYAMRTFPAGAVEDQRSDPEKLYGSTPKLKDVLLFEELPKAGDLVFHLELPGAVFGDAGRGDRLEFNLVRSSIKNQDLDPEKEKLRTTKQSPKPAKPSAGPAGVSPEKTPTSKRKPADYSSHEPKTKPKPKQASPPPDDDPLGLGIREGLPQGKPFGPEDH